MLIALAPSLRSPEDAWRVNQLIGSLPRCDLGLLLSATTIGVQWPRASQWRPVMLTDAVVYSPDETLSVDWRQLELVFGDRFQLRGGRPLSFDVEKIRQAWIEACSAVERDAKPREVLTEYRRLYPDGPSPSIETIRKRVREFREDDAAA
ncbi:MAG: hypothetical protein AAFW46_13570 [Pseudomonadota bacterium]